MWNGIQDTIHCCPAPAPAATILLLIFAQWK
jgi:hypothetical protein